MPKPRGSGTVKKSTVHHCPRAGKGNGPCVYVKKNGVPYCREHCWICDVPGHGNSVQLGNQDCEKCKRAEQMPLKQEAEDKAQQIAENHPKLKKYAKQK